MLNKKTVDDLKDLQGKKVLVRCDLNVPLRGGVIQSCNYIDDATPTIKKLLDQGTKVILYSHLGKPKGEPLPEISLAPAAPVLSKRLGMEAESVSGPVVTGAETQKLAAELEDDEALLFENTHYRVEETKYGRDEKAKDYTKELAALCDNGVPVNDAFGTAHRAYCSNVDVTEYTKENVVGYLVEKEIKFLGGAAENPVRPFVAILSGAKVSDKISVINDLLDKVDALIIGGGMAYTFTKARGQEIGNSLCEKDKLDYALETVKKTETEDVKLLLPADHVKGKEFSDDTERKAVKTADTGQSGSDTGSKTIELYKKTLEDAKAVVWSGPVGMLESFNFAEETLEVRRVMAELKDATTVIGDGDPVSAVRRLGFADKMAHTSTSSGASLESSEGKELPSVAAANNR